MKQKYKIRICPECKTKRWIYFIRFFKLEGKDYREFKCSKGHIWKVCVGPIEQFIKTEIDRITPYIKSLFERDDLFYTKLKR